MWVRDSYFDTDKVEPHGYFRSYMRIAAQLGPGARICELGVKNGESLRMLQSLFPVGEVTGVDNDEDSFWPEGTVQVISDQGDPGLPGKLGGPFDLIIDDASHDGILTQRSWLLLWPLVKPGGYYVIEDWAVALRSDEHWGPCWGPSMLKVAESFLTMLGYRDGELEEAAYRYGLIILRKSNHAAIKKECK